MEHAFWHQRWREGRIGFHQAKINSRLRKHFHALALARGAAVFVPLCGKSLDLLWLAEQGCRVIGNEISDIACRDFYVENNLRYAIESESDQDDGARYTRYTRYISDDIELWRGDFFALRRSDLRDAAGVYDRAALIALPATMRPDYAAHLARLLRRGARVLLISMDYDERKMKGPPFSVPEAEVRDLFAADFTLKLITQSSGPDIVGHLAERGLDSLNEKVYLLQRR